ncbi:Alpha/Beta hydrolase protein [Catenaria anguillulae PL171]|uniref:Alpha/Beta hydrolase protein n=1 Tax=Catenaria anguillulae PL171 TaxID=765915 RepID=A0A1Y2HYZ2_9FUNG|nr:Alpha/Beta hydrolase protein [Catenaria anguillulae PL171]
MSGINKACCSIPPIASTYQPKGTNLKLSNGVNAYVTGPANAKLGIVHVYDIFGFHPATEQVADLIAESLGARLVMPDFWLGKPWSLEKFPPQKDLNEFSSWVKSAGDFNTKVKPLIEAAATQLRSEGATKVGLIGLCWGSKMVAQAAKDCTDLIDGGAMLHPAFLVLDDIKSAKVPLCILPSKDEPDMTAYQKVLKEQGQLNVFERFDDMHHGWCGARADFDNELNRKRTHDAIKLVVHFFERLIASSA